MEEIRQNNSGEFFIIEGKNLKKSTSTHSYYDIRFLKSGYTDTVRGDSINKGWVKDNLSKNCCGIGAIGYVNTREHLKEYRIWRNIIYRCYCKFDKSYKYYGEKGVKVCDRWHRFDYFLQDIKCLPGYDNNLFQTGKLKLDKDILSKNKKIYSPKTCLWVSDLENQKRRAFEYNEKHPKYAIFPDGHIEQIFHISDFCKKHNLHRQNVNLCLSGKQKSTKGFKFYKE